MCETIISYYTDMEEIGSLLSSAANPVEFMCQVRRLERKPEFSGDGFSALGSSALNLLFGR